jgi:hypothetical protein
MNSTERQMVDLLLRGKDEFDVVSVKAEFEAEGTRMDELLRLMDIARAAGLPLTVKIGGCEAIRDLLESKQIGVAYIVAPMVETPYALSKFIAAKNMVFEDESQIDTDFLVNIETQTGYEHLDGLVSIGRQDKGLDGIVFGRVDFVGSRGEHRDSINSESVTDAALVVSERCEQAQIDLVVGGGVSMEALPALRRINEVYLTRFETRKVVFASSALRRKEIGAGLLNAVHFELLWLVNKREYYGRLTQEDEKRIRMLNDRWDVLS